MIKVMIADDEQNIIDLIKLLIDWKNIELIGEANDGVKALHLIETCHPDVAIIDIRMPEVDGLQLIEKTRALGLDTHFIIISGYQEFEYARRAMRFGVQDYLSKPVRRDELNHALDRLCTHIDIEQAHTEMQLEVERTLHQQKKEQREKVLSMAEQGLSIVQTDWQKAFACAPQDIVVYALQLELSVVLESDLEDYRQLTMSIMSELCDCAARMGYETVCLLGTHWDGLVFVSEIGTIAELDDEFLRCIRREAYRYEQGEFVLGRAERNIFCDLGEQIQIARAALCRRVECGAGLLFTAQEKLPSLPQNLQMALERFKSDVIAADAEACLGTLFNLLAAFQHAHQSVHFLLYQLADQIVGSLGLLDHDGDNPAIETRLCTCACKVWCSHSIENITYALRECTRQTIDLYLEWRNTQDDLPVRQIKQYIAAHLGEPVSLESVAEVVHMNAVYLSTYFKNKTGQNFSAYLTNERMNAAKELLKRPDLSLQEVALQVGYADYRHFSKLFSKTVGVKPNEFRRFYS